MKTPNMEEDELHVFEPAAAEWPSHVSSNPIILSCHHSRPPTHGIGSHAAYLGTHFPFLRFSGFLPATVRHPSVRRRGEQFIVIGENLESPVRKSEGGGQRAVGSGPTIHLHLSLSPLGVRVQSSGERPSVTATARS